MVKPNQSATSDYVERAEEKQRSFVDDLFDDPQPRVLVTDTFSSVIINPVTCCMVDLSNMSSSGIDSAIECLSDVKNVIDKLYSIKKQIERMLAGLADKSGTSRTKYVRGHKAEIKLEFPGRSFNNAALKKLYHALADEPVFNPKVRRDEWQNLKDQQVALRDEFLRITEVAVNMKEFKHAEVTDTGPEYVLKLRDLIKCSEEKPYEDPRITIISGEGGDIGSDPFIIQRVEPE